MRLTLGVIVALAASSGCSSNDSKCLPSCVDPPIIDAPAEAPVMDAAVEGTTIDEAIEGSGCDIDARFECAEHGSGHFCSDLTVPASCVDGSWRCEGSVPAAECRCFGPIGNGCTYTPECVLQCPDGGDAGDAG
jgi:hypothetical protein